MKAVRYAGSDGEAHIGRLDDDTIIDAGPAGPEGFVPSDAAWAALGNASGDQHASGEMTLLHPVVPRKILAIGLNYRSHAE